MNRQDAASSRDEVLISKETPIKDVVSALVKRGCTDLASDINHDACGEYPFVGGGACDVYRGELLGGTKIAIKCLRIYGPDAEMMEKETLKHAAKELYHWSKLRHPNVLPLLGLAVFRGRISMISEWMENQSVMSFLVRNPNENRLYLCMDICMGLDYIHTNGVTHGDLKGVNVLVSPSGIAMITDFGSAWLKDATLKLSSIRDYPITVQWAAPERIKDSSSPPSKESDVYTYGITALEVLTGEVPFKERSEQGRVYDTLHQETCHPSRPDINLDDSLWELMRSCWTYDPAKRPSIMSVKNRLQVLYPGYTSERASRASVSSMPATPARAISATPARTSTSVPSTRAALTRVPTPKEPPIRAEDFSTVSDTPQERSSEATATRPMVLPHRPTIASFLQHTFDATIHHLKDHIPDELSTFSTLLDPLKRLSSPRFNWGIQARELCKLWTEHITAGFRLSHFEWYREKIGARHEFLIFGLENTRIPGRRGKNLLLRVEHRPTKDLKRKRDTLTRLIRWHEAYDIVTISHQKENLLHWDAMPAELQTSVPLGEKVSLAYLVNVLKIIHDESYAYHLAGANCWFYASTIAEIALCKSRGEWKCESLERCDHRKAKDWAQYRQIIMEQAKRL